MPGRGLSPKPSIFDRAGRSFLRMLGLHPEDGEAVRMDLRGRSALCIATNHGVLNIGVPTGVFGSELTVPYYIFLDAGMKVDVASPGGGIVPVEPMSMKGAIRTAEDDRMLGDADFRRKLMQSLPVAGVDFTAYDIVYLAGGWGAAFDFGQSEELGVRMSEAHAAGRRADGSVRSFLRARSERRAD